jgi:hypothetical protein
MNDTMIITSYVVIDDMMRSLNHRSHILAKVTDAEVLTVAVVAAKYFHNNHERALWALTRLGYLSGPLSTSRFNRRLHALCDWLQLTLDTLGELFASGAVFIIDSMPLPVCRRERASSATKAITARRMRRPSSMTPGCA